MGLSISSNSITGNIIGAILLLQYKIKGVANTIALLRDALIESRKNLIIYHIQSTI